MTEGACHSTSCPRASVVVCAYTTRRWSALCDAIEAVLAQDPHELIVVIDHNDALLARIRARFPDARALPNEGARGLSAARNMGVESSTGDVVVFLDDDARPRQDWLKSIVRVFNDPAVIGAGGVALPLWESHQPDWIPPEFYWVVGCSYLGLPEHPVEIRNPIGACMAFRRRVLADVGGFTDGIGRVGKIPLGCEETELSIRASALAGGHIVFVPDAEVEHFVPDERTTWSYFRHRCWAEGLSKAIVMRSVGQDLALQSERSYVSRTLPMGVCRGLRDSVTGDVMGLVRAAAIIGGLLITSAGYVKGMVASLDPGA